MELTLQEVKSFLRVDFEEDDAYINMLINISETYLDIQVGVNYKNDTKLTELAKILKLKYISDMYENRGTTIATSTKTDSFINSILIQLSLVGDTIV